MFGMLWILLILELFIVIHTFWENSVQFWKV